MRHYLIIFDQATYWIESTSVEAALKSARRDGIDLPVLAIIDQTEDFAQRIIIELLKDYPNPLRYHLFPSQN